LFATHNEVYTDESHHVQQITVLPDDRKEQEFDVFLKNYYRELKDNRVQMFAGTVKLNARNGQYKKRVLTLRKNNNRFPARH
jgi:hypothetical protein